MLMAASFAVVFLRLDLCNAPTGVKGQTLAKRVRLLGKSTESYGRPEVTRCRLVLRWTSKLGRCLTRQSKRVALRRRWRRLSAISLRLKTYEGFHKGTTRSSMNEMNGVL